MFELILARTNPCTHLSVLNIMHLLEHSEDFNPNHEAHQVRGKNKSNNFAIHDTMRTHRAVEYDLDYLNKNQKATCRCIGLLDSEVVYWNLEGPCRPTVRAFLLLGLDVNFFH